MGETRVDLQHLLEDLRQCIQLPSKSINRRPAHYGLDIQFEDRPDDIELAA